MSARSAWTVWFKSWAAQVCNISARVTVPSVGCCFVRPRSSSVTCLNRIRLAFRARANAATSCEGVSDSVPACGSFGSKSTNSCPAKKAWKRTGKTRRSASSKCCKQWIADHCPAAGGRVRRSIGSVLTSRCQRSGVVERTARTSSNQVVNEHLLLFDPLPEEDINRSLSSKCFLTGLFLSPQSYPTKRKPGHCLPNVCPEIHPLLRRPETFRLTHQLFISNRSEDAQLRGTQKLRTNQSGINEEHVLRGKGRGNRTYILLIIEKCINNLSGTDGFRLCCHQFYISSLALLANCISRSKTCSPTTVHMTSALLRWGANGDQAQNTPNTEFPLNTGS